MWIKESDGFFTYYRNVKTGEKKLKLPDGGVEVDALSVLDDFGSFGGAKEETDVSL